MLECTRRWWPGRDPGTAWQREGGMNSQRRSHSSLKVGQPAAKSSTKSSPEMDKKWATPHNRQGANSVCGGFAQDSVCRATEGLGNTWRCLFLSATTKTNTLHAHAHRSKQTYQTHNGRKTQHLHRQRGGKKYVSAASQRATGTYFNVQHGTP